MLDVPPAPHRPWRSPPIGSSQLLETLLKRNGITLDRCQPPKSLLDAQCSHHLLGQSAANRRHLDEPISNAVPISTPDSTTRTDSERCHS